MCSAQCICTSNMDHTPFCPRFKVIYTYATHYHDEIHWYLYVIHAQCLWPTLQTVYYFAIQILENFEFCYKKINDQIRSQFHKFHGSSTAVVCANLLPDWVNWIITKKSRIFIRFQLEAHKTSVKWNTAVTDGDRITDTHSVCFIWVNVDDIGIQTINRSCSYLHQPSMVRT